MTVDVEGRLRELRIEKNRLSPVITCLWCVNFWFKFFELEKFRISYRRTEHPWKMIKLALSAHLNGKWAKWAIQDRQKHLYKIWFLICRKKHIGHDTWLPVCGWKNKSLRFIFSWEREKFFFGQLQYKQAKRTRSYEQNCICKSELMKLATFSSEVLENDHFRVESRRSTL